MSAPRTCERAPILASLCLLAGAAVALQLSYSEPGLLYLAPALLLLVALNFDWYPGERLLAALARTWHQICHRETAAPARRIVPLRFLPRGSALLATALAGRGPPS